jgi:7-cyano-7-deazaguanine tRNA-ribosyltransferase
MSFEIKEEDLLGRIGRLKTKNGTVETPALLPVVNPAIQPVLPERMKREFGFEALTTNAYIIKQRFQDQPVRDGIHRFINFDGAIMTDSGAYQILVYGDIQTNPKEIVSYQERINTDIATILDIPTGWKISKEKAQRTVRETLRRARELFKSKTRDGILWVGPVQGGRYLDLVARSAERMRGLPFDIHALGSPTEVMEHYRFDVLVEMIMTAKMNLPIDRPLHLFGAGHPFMFTLAVASGCDLFDSAAYALYAREDRYMTENGTHRLNELTYFPCSCPKCSGSTPKQVLELERKKRITFLAEHNLYVCGSEIKRVKQAIKDGRLWEHLEMRAHAHPALFRAIRALSKYGEFVERHSPVSKNSGLFFFNSLSLMRPEVVHYRSILKQRYAKPRGAETLLLCPETETKPFHKSKEYKQIMKALKRRGQEESRDHVCFYAAPFGVVPIELTEVFPLSQHETVLPPDREMTEYVADQIAEHLNRTKYRKVTLINDEKNWGKTIVDKCRKTCRRNGIKFETLSIENVLSEKPRTKRTDESAVA